MMITSTTRLIILEGARSNHESTFIMTWGRYTARRHAYAEHTMSRRPLAKRAYQQLRERETAAPGERAGRPIYRDKKAKNHGAASGNAGYVFHGISLQTALTRKYTIRRKDGFLSVKASTRQQAIIVILDHRIEGPDVYLLS